MAQLVNTDSVSYGWLAAQVVGAMVFIILLAVIIIRYLLPKVMNMRRRADSSIEILDFQPIENRKNIYLVKIEDKKVAVVLSENSIAKLCEWDVDEQE